ncbi:phosphatase PAP2 family protein [Salicola sp. Rm-C-2C1-2]|uniref:phosphatase PAP2 family protein n=1 Tax=Salicola sp. Rm-C-2C1-2 TaxID=3141321 RepID=UPI0032E43C8A
MALQRLSRVLTRIDHSELQWCLRLNRSLTLPAVTPFFRIVSRLGDGWLWYALILTLPAIDGLHGWALAALMTLTGTACTLVYKVLKTQLVRERPFISLPAIQCGSPPLDRGSFPSGHSLHAVCFTILLFQGVPLVGWTVLPFTMAVLASRVVLGLHYPSDVLAGSLIGAGCAFIALHFAPGFFALLPQGAG